MNVTTDPTKLRALREAISIEHWIGPGAGAPRRSDCSVTLRLRMGTPHATAIAAAQAAHVLAAAVFPVAEAHQAAHPYVDVQTGDVVIEATHVATAQALRAAAGRMDLTSMVARALLAVAPGGDE